MKTKTPPQGKIWNGVKSVRQYLVAPALCAKNPMA